MPSMFLTAPQLTQELVRAYGWPLGWVESGPVQEAIAALLEDVKFTDRTEAILALDIYFELLHGRPLGFWKSRHYAATA